MKCCLLFHWVVSPWKNLILDKMWFKTTSQCSVYSSVLQMGASALQTRICNKVIAILFRLSRKWLANYLEIHVDRCFKHSFPTQHLKTLPPVHCIEEVMQNVCVKWYKTRFFYFVKNKLFFMGHKSSLNFSLTPGNALEVLHGLPGRERERAAQSRDLGLWRATGSWVEVPLLCLLLPIYRCVGLIEKRKHKVQRGDSSLPLGVKQRWTSTYFYLVYRRKNPINITSLCNALAGMETHLLCTAESSETKGSFIVYPSVLGSVHCTYLCIYLGQSTWCVHPE